MTREWPAFNSSATCAKCLHDDIGAQYMDGYHWKVPGSIDGEWIKRTCRRCGYVWPEETLDTRVVPR